MAATAGSSSSPCASFVEETLLLPTRNARLFAPVFALVFAHTFVFLAVAVLLAHPLASVQLHDGLSSWRDATYALSTDKIRQHGVVLLILYLAYLASKLATQATVCLAASATLRSSGDNRPSSLAGLFRDKAPRGLFTGAALVAAVELASTAVLATCLASWWSYGAAHLDTGRVESFVQGVLLFLFLLALLFRLCLAAVFQVAIAASASREEGCDGGGGASALLRAWRFMTTTARRKEAAVQVLVVSVVLPVATYPVYAFALYCAHGESVFLLGGLHGFVLPSAGVQLYSTVAATMFYHRCVELHPEPAIPLTVKLAKISETLSSPEPADRS
ncbi:uncharacterized protein LOC124668666 [Lolium rigidum]|uniref:uncharacterized protein LOC124668666 n=1 Tax=Lolium rigidum TaxID=89674 RepID=UPI001F5D4A1F|nr:uncharacterized protein LOC124668666 [Lolium rigidum]